MVKDHTPELLVTPTLDFKNEIIVVPQLRGGFSIPSEGLG
jgi:hypothetical protein